MLSGKSTTYIWSAILRSPLLAHRAVFYEIAITPHFASLLTIQAQ
jgi:hypothetical protein